MRNLKLKTKIIALCLGVTALGTSIGIVGYVTLNSVTKDYHQVTNVDLPVVRALADLRAHLRELRIHLRSIAFVDVTPSEAKEYVKLALPEIDFVENQLKAITDIDHSAKDRKSYQDLILAWNEFKTFGQDLMTLANDPTANQKEIVRMVKEVCPTKAKAVLDILLLETELAMKASDASVAAANSTETKGNTLILLIALASIFASISLGWLFSKKISDTLTDVAHRLTSSGEQIIQAIGSLGSSSRELSEASTESAASLEQTVASLEELTSMVKRNSEYAQEAASISIASRNSAENGEVEMKKLIQSMSLISDSSKKIEEIINVIDDIAFQTNLLALNASVEAARAGEQGRGFAVVADAVRSLAQRSANAAKDISELIKDSVNKIEEGAKFADHSGEVLNEIVSSVKKVSDLNAEIAAASKEQSIGIHQISTAMNQLDTATQSNSASAEQIVTIIDDFNELAKTSQELTSKLKTVVYGASLSQASPAATTGDKNNKTSAKPKASAAFKETLPKNVHKLPLKKKVAKSTPAASSDAKSLIPFDEDDGRGVGTAEGF